MSSGPRRAAIVVAAVAAVAAAAAATGCGPARHDASPEGLAAEYRSRAEATEQAGDREETLASYRDAARRFPTAAWAWAGTGRAAEALGRFPEAEEAYRTAVRWDSTRVDERAAIAALAIEDGRGEAALAVVEQAIATAGPTTRLLVLKARALAAGGRWSEAALVADRALEQAPDDGGARLARAWIRAGSDTTADALDALDALAREMPGDPDVLAARARALRPRDAAAAAAELQRALDAADAPRPRDLTLLAEWRLDDGDPHGAADAFAAVLRENPRSARALEGLGRAARATGDDALAEQAFTRAMEAAPDFAPAYLAMGRLRMQQDRSDEAVALLRRARARADDPALQESAELALAEVHLRLGEPGPATELLNGVLGRNPASAEAVALRGRALLAAAEDPRAGTELERLASRPGASREETLAFCEWLLLHGDAERALEAADRVLAAHPDDPEAAQAQEEARAAALGRRAAELGRWDEARAAFRHRIQLRPDRAAPWLALGRTELEAGDPSAAVACFERAGELDSLAWFPQFQRAMALERAGRVREAAEAYGEVLARNDRVGEAHNNLAWLLADHGLDPAGAEEHARRAAELVPGNADVLGTLGWSLTRNGKHDEAVEVLRSACQRAPEDAMKHYLLGMAMAARGDASEARAALRDALRLDPAFARAAEAREALERLAE